MNKAVLILTPSDSALVCEGEIDLSTTDDFRAALSAQPVHEGMITVDMRAAWFIDSAGLAALIAVFKRGQAEGFTLRLLVKPGGQPERVLGLSGMNTLAGMTVLSQPL